MRAINNPYNLLLNIWRESINHNITMMKLQKLSILFVPVFVLLPHLLEARQAQTMTFDANSSLILQEFTALLTVEEDEIRVRLQMSGNSNENGEDRLEAGDVVLMMNGKRATDLGTLRTLYESVEDGEEVKIGVRRGEERFILRATKGDVPEGSSSGGRRVISRTTTNAPGASSINAPASSVMSFNTDVEGATPVMVTELGSVLLDRDEKVVVERAIPMIMPEALKSEEIEGYTILSVNGKEYKTAQEVADALKEIEVGEAIELELEKDGDQISIVFNKEASRGNVSFSTGN